MIRIIQRSQIVLKLIFTINRLFFKQENLATKAPIFELNAQSIIVAFQASSGAQTDL
jgi:hypothetical protein